MTRLIGLKNLTDEQILEVCCLLMPQVRDHKHTYSVIWLDDATAQVRSEVGDYTFTIYPDVGKMYRGEILVEMEEHPFQDGSLTVTPSIYDSYNAVKYMLSTGVVRLEHD